MSNFNLNLLPSQAKFQASKIRLNNLVKKIIIWLVSLWLVSMAIVMLMNLIIKMRINTVSDQYKKAQTEYLALSDSILINQKLKYRAKMVGGVLNQRFEYGMAFESITNLFPAGIVMTNFELKDRGSFEISGITTGKSNVDGLEILVDDINSGRNENFTKANLTSISKKADTWSFSMEVVMK
jgi:hypothetical protein